MTKRALLIGINYRGTGNALAGCINDVHGVKAMLLSKGFPEENIVMLTDDLKKPTKANILDELNNVCTSGAENIFIHYSGHGTQVKDHNGDEPDGKDEAICPLDFRHCGMISDDVIKAHLMKVPAGHKVFCVFDSCHSGTVCDLGFNIVKRKNRLIFARDNRQAETPANVVLVSGCLDQQVSVDGFMNNRPTGALTWAFLFAIQHMGVQNWGQLFRAVHKMIKKCRTRQYPHISSGRHIQTTDLLYL